jgi:hypothetical protein
MLGTMKRITNKIRVLFQVQRGFLFRYGWLRAWWVGRPVDASGNPLPWITYPAIDFISQFDFSNALVFEWGSGFSTLWWAKRCKKIATVESNAAWIPYIKGLLPPCVELIVTRPDVDEEINALLEHSIVQRDVFIIDNHGPFRWRCAEVAAKNVLPGGMIILDNSDQCLKASKVLRDNGFTQIDFTGFCPGGGYGHATSIFFRETLKFKTRESDQPQLGPAQPNPPWPKC